MKNHNTVNGWIFTFDNVIKNKVPIVYVTLKFKPHLAYWILRASYSEQGQNDKAVLAPQITTSQTLIHVITQRILNKRIGDNAFANTIREQTSMCM